MAATTGLSPQNPTKYRGPRDYLVTTVSRNRRPLSSDFRQPETGQNYPITTVWQVGKNPTTGVEGELWLLAKIVANVATWIMVTGGSIGPIDNFTVDNVTAPGTNPVNANFAGNVVVHGTTVAAGSIPVDTRSVAQFQYQIEVQTTQAIASTDVTKIGLAAFNSADFTVDANGFVSLIGGSTAIGKVTVQAHTAPGTSPVVADGSGNVNVSGTIVAAHAIPIRTDSLAANSYNIEVQFSSAAASTSANNAGMASFNNTQFSVDANGFVSLTGSGAPLEELAGDSGTATPSGSPETITLASDSNYHATPAGGIITATGSTVTFNFTNVLAYATPIGSQRMSTGQFTEVAIGTAALSSTALINIENDQNNLTGIYIKNTNSGVNSETGIVLDNGTTLTTIYQEGTGFSPVSNQFFINTTSAAQRYQVPAGGSFIWETTSNNNVIAIIDQTSVRASVNSGLSPSFQWAVNALGTYWTLGSNSGASNVLQLCSGGTLGTNIVLQVASTGLNLKGDSTGNAPAAGYIGERLTATFSTVSLPTGTLVNLTNIVLTAGVWDITLMANYTGATAGSYVLAAVSANSASLTGTVPGDSTANMPFLNQTTSGQTLTVAAFRVTTTGATYYAIGNAVYTVGTMVVQGRLSAVRVA